MSVCLTDYLENSARRFADKPALTENGAAVCTYRELRDIARRAATALARQNVQGTVLVMAERSVQAVQAILAVLYAGAAYAPLDPASPPARLRDICAALDKPPVLCTRQQLTRCPALTELCGQVLVWEELIESSPNDALLENRRQAVCPDQTLCVMFTSGSTGVPKGVVKTHAAMDAFERAFTGQFSLTDSANWGNQSPFYFDASAKELYSVLRTGATLHILSTGLFSQPLELVRTLNALQIDTISWVPSALCILSRMDAFSVEKPAFLQRIFFVGEVFPIEHFRIWQAALPEVAFTNLYGPTETAGIGCWYTVPAAFSGQVLPIGGPLPGVAVQLRDENGRIIEQPDVQGEIWLGGETLAKGYLNDPERTARMFVTENGMRFYRTGDLASRNGQGLLVFRSRADHQIKHMGHRIELGEIETRAGAFPGVDRCCCVHDGTKERLILFYQGTAPMKELYIYLRRELPRYMVPARLVPCEALACNANGKLDRPAMTRRAAEL